MLDHKQPRLLQLTLGLLTTPPQQPDIVQRPQEALKKIEVVIPFAYPSENLRIIKQIQNDEILEDVVEV